jgi:hypothetical protein
LAGRQMQVSASESRYIQIDTWHGIGSDHLLWGAVENDSSTPRSSSSAGCKVPRDLEGVTCLESSGSSDSVGTGNPKTKARVDYSSSSKAPQEGADTTSLKSLPRASLIEKLPVDKNGEPTSIGSREHSKGYSCCPCAMLAQGRPCPNGIYCDFCRFPHRESRRREKKPWTET